MPLKLERRRGPFFGPMNTRLSSPGRGELLQVCREFWQEEGSKALTRLPASDLGGPITSEPPTSSTTDSSARSLPEASSM